MKKLLPLLLAAPLLTASAHAAARDINDPLRATYNHLSLGYVGGDYGYSAGQIDASVALGRVPYLFAVATLGGKDDIGSNDVYGFGIGFRIRTTEETSLDIDLGFAQQQLDNYDNNMVGLGLGFRSAIGDKVTLVARARYFISNLEVYDNTLYAENFAELSLAANYHFNQNFFLGLRLSKNVGQYDDFRYSLSAAFSF
jgi:hypothetical protein